MAVSLSVQVVAVVLVAMVLLLDDGADAYGSHSRRRYSRVPSFGRSRSSSFYGRYGSGSRQRSTPRARYVHGYGSSGHRHPHAPNAIGLPIGVLDLDDDDYHLAEKFMPYGYGDTLLQPIETLLRDLAGYTGYKQTSIPNIVRNIKHEFYIGANKMDPLLHSILKRYGFMFTGNPADLGMGMGMGMGGSQGNLNNILGSIGIGGNGGYNGVSSVQNPIPGVNSGAINDDLFDDFGNGLLGLAASSNTAASKQQQKTPDLGSDPLGIF